MSTAPKDGRVDLWWIDRRFVDCYRDPIDGGYRHMTHFNQLIMVESPTAWMPLPDAPKEMP